MSEKLKRKLNQLDIVIVSHIFASGPALELEQYLKEKTSSLLFIGHPFTFRKDTRSFYRYYKKGALKTKHTTLEIKTPETINYLKEFILTLVWVIKHGRHGLYIGSDGFSAFMGLILKRLGVVRQVILYTIDYSPRRFKSGVLNYMYHYFDKTCLKNCDSVWNVSREIARARKKYPDLNKNKFKKQQTVPLGVWFDRIPKTPISKRNKNSIVFLGHILEKQGIDQVIKAIPIVKRKIPNVKFNIIGTGEHLNSLKKLVKDLNISKNVKFFGYIKSHKRLEELLSKNLLAVATYKPYPKSFTYYADPGKVKNYLAAGLPVLITDVPKIAREISKKKCGVICEYDPGDISRQVIKLLSNKKRLEKYSGNAINFAKKYDWNAIYSRALIRTFQK